MKTQLPFRPHALLASTLFPLLLLIGCSAGDEDHEGHEDESEEAHSEDEGYDEHEGEEGHVELTEQQFRSAGIEVTVAKPGRVTEALTLPGTIAPNADAVLHVTPRVSGQVRSVSKHLGESVQADEILCVIDSVELGAAVADYMRDREMVSAAEETLERERELYAGRLEAQTSVLEGAIEQAVHHPHFIARGTVRTVTDPLAGEVTIPGFPFRSSDDLPPDDYHTAALGEHNAEVLQNLLGMSDEQIADLEDRGLLASKPH